ncbi:prophage Lp1 protein 31 [Paucilactobacillus vaccinostercus DSM 20634]|uniref:Prophage Lp1 protein 31 n=1 Tax=Paucilactobacillus vaccinostercus DSM 20634 TaxID=1423813 RepID=A0A0R2AE54_9LACO|nr:DUF1642 domain-containing protein [Paucilactobacillus vaccinostercus]KRM62089.1 prophage Lp1 protein 31 [Paucilactobacillus vaccinostercus DSM 20634]
MTKYIKTGTTEFEQFDGSDEMIGKYDIDPEQIGEGMPMYQLETLKGTIQIFIGDWIATGVEGEHWPVKDEIFQKTYKKLPVIPYSVAKYIEEVKRGETDLDQGEINIYGAIYGALDWDQASCKESDWIQAHSDEFARAWLDGYEVAEVEE